MISVCFFIVVVSCENRECGLWCGRSYNGVIRSGGSDGNGGFRGGWAEGLFNGRGCWVGIYKVGDLLIGICYYIVSGLSDCDIR